MLILPYQDPFSEGCVNPHWEALIGNEIAFTEWPRVLFHDACMPDYEYKFNRLINRIMIQVVIFQIMANKRSVTLTGKKLNCRFGTSVSIDVRNVKWGLKIING